MGCGTKYQKKKKIENKVLSLDDSVLIHRKRGAFDKLQAICNSFGIERIRPPKWSQPTVISLNHVGYLGNQTSGAGGAVVTPLDATTTSSVSAKTFL